MRTCDEWEKEKRAVRGMQKQELKEQYQVGICQEKSTENIKSKILSDINLLVVVTPNVGRVSNEFV